MGRKKQEDKREDVREDRSETNLERIKREAFERRERNGNMDDFNRKLHIDTGILERLYPGFTFRWVRDRGARLHQFVSRGWTFVPEHPDISIGDPSVGGGNTDMSGKISVISGEDNSKDEGAYRSFLMMLPVELHKEDRAKLQARNDELEKQIKRTLRNEGEKQVENAYGNTAKIESNMSESKYVA